MAKGDLTVSHFRGGLLRAMQFSSSSRDGTSGIAFMAANLNFVFVLVLAFIVTEIYV